MRQRVYLEKAEEWMEIACLEQGMITEIMKLREDIWKAVDKKDWFAAAEETDFIRALEHGFGLVGLINQTVVACLICILQGGEYGEDCGYDYETVKSCADYEDVFVKVEYRGNQIQNILEKVMEKRCREVGKKRILGTVSPDNIYSLNNFDIAGYKEVERVRKYEGLMRVMLEKQLDVEVR